MKQLISKTIPYIGLFILIHFSAQAQYTNIEQDKVCINCPTENPDPSAVLEVKATNKGVLIPRVANTAVINNPAEGLMIYDNSTNDFKYYDGGIWQSMGLKHISFPSYKSTYIGINAGISDTGGSYNTGSGYKALEANTTGAGNTATGTNALNSNTTGVNNIATGYNALRYNTTGQHNTANGQAALLNNTTGRANSATGYRAMQNNTEGIANTADGWYALYNNTTGEGNTALGVSTLRSNTIGNYNTAIGRTAFLNDSTFNNSTAIGYNAQPTGSNQVRLGNHAVTEIGGYANWSNVSDARFKKQVKNDVPGLAFINQLKPVTYQMNIVAIAKFHQTPDSLRFAKSEKTKAVVRYTGFLAQDVEKAAQAIGYNFSGIDKPQHNKDHYSLRYAEFVVPLVKAVQELSKEKAALETRLEKLEVLLQ